VYTGKMDIKDEKKITSEKPVSLAPLDLQEALGALLKVKPQPKEKPKKNPKSQKKPSG
jgi:hypothetical protein